MIEGVALVSKPHKQIGQFAEAHRYLKEVIALPDSPRLEEEGKKILELEKEIRNCGSPAR